MGALRQFKDWINSKSIWGGRIY